MNRQRVAGRAMIAAVLAGQSRYGPAIRVPDMRGGLRWWKATTGCQVLVKNRVGDLEVSLIRTAAPHGALLLVIGGPGALEVPESESARPRTAGPKDIVDPWGNSVAAR